MTTRIMGPPWALLKAHECVVSLLIERTTPIQCRCRTPVVFHDALVLRLISGEIRVPVAQRLAAR